MLMQKAPLLLSIKDLTREKREEKRSKKLEKTLRKVNQVIEAPPLLTKKVDNVSKSESTRLRCSNCCD